MNETELSARLDAIEARLSALEAGKTHAARRSNRCLSLLCVNEADKTSEPQNYLVKKQVAEMLSVSVSTIEGMMRRRSLPYYKFGKSVRFNRADVQARLDETCRVAGPARRSNR